MRARSHKATRLTAKDVVVERAAWIAARSSSKYLGTVLWHSGEYCTSNFNSEKGQDVGSKLSLALPLYIILRVNSV